MRTVICRLRSLAMESYEEIVANDTTAVQRENDQRFSNRFGCLKAFRNDFFSRIGSQYCSKFVEYKK